MFCFSICQLRLTTSMCADCMLHGTRSLGPELYFEILMISGISKADSRFYCLEIFEIKINENGRL